MNKIVVFFMVVAHGLHGQQSQLQIQHKKNSFDHAMNHAKDHDAHDMHGMYGNYPMTREASGTSWVPDSTPQQGFHKLYRDWTFMFLGFSYLIFDNQRGPRGDAKLFDENMFMFMAQKDWNKTTFAFRSMFSFEPFTIGKCGYPLLLQNGETCDGVTELIDRQHPHDLFMELALVATYRFNECGSYFLYAGLPGEPALGPPVYIMRYASEYIPEAPLGHHWMDSTHITFGVITAGFVYNGFKCEVSGFRGREPDQDRYDIEKPKIDSYSIRVSWNPTENWALQASYGFLKSPEQLHPEKNIGRTVYSVLYNKPFWQDSNLQMCAIVGINDEKPGNRLPAFLLDTTIEFHECHMIFNRIEALKKNDLFQEPDPLAHKVIPVKKVTIGYIYEFITGKHLKWGLGGLLDFPMVDNRAAAKRYGSDTSYMLFLQMRLI